MQVLTVYNCVSWPPKWLTFFLSHPILAWTDQLLLFNMPSLNPISLLLIKWTDGWWKCYHCRQWQSRQLCKWYLHTLMSPDPFINLIWKQLFSRTAKQPHLRVLPLLWGTSQTTQPPHHNVTHEFVPSDMVTTEWKVVYTGKLGNSHFGSKQWYSDHTCQCTQVSLVSPPFLLIV